jgi:hypothetical protein
MSAFIFFKTMCKLNDIVSQKEVTSGFKFKRLVFIAVIISVGGCATERKITGPTRLDLGGAT